MVVAAREMGAVVKDKVYCGIHNDKYGGMTSIGSIVKDAWLFGLLPETESCEGWTNAQFEKLQQDIAKAWDQYGLLVGNLPAELRERHHRIHDEAIQRARAMGWDPDTELSDES